MSLQPQNLPIDFSNGVDTKSDPKVVQGKMSDVRNAVMTSPGQYQKRAGYVALPTTTENHSVGLNSAVPNTISTGRWLAAFNNETVMGDGLNQYSYNAATGTQVFKGSNVAATITSKVVINQSPDANTAISVPDWCTNGTLNAYCMYSSVSGVLATVQDAATGQILSANGTFVGTSPRMASAGGKLTLLYVNGANQIVWSQWVAGVGWSNPATLISDPYNTLGLAKYDVTVVGTTLYVAYGSSSNTIKVASFTSSMVPVASISQSDNPGLGTSSSISIVGDSTNIWVTYQSSGNLRNFIVNPALSSTLIAPYTVASPSSILNITSTITSAGLTIFYDGGSVGAVGAGTFYASVTSGGSVSSSGTFIYSLYVVSKAWTYGGIPYVAMAYISPGQPSAMTSVQPIGAVGGLFNGVGVGATIVGTFAQGQLAQTYGGTSPAAVVVSGATVSFVCPLYAPLAGYGYTKAVVNYATTSQNSVTLGRNLITAGATTVSYDGTAVAEQNFYLYPEGASSTVTSGSSSAGKYSYIFLWEWTDAQGNVHQSAPSQTYTLTLTASQGVTWQLPRLYLTGKRHVLLVPFRTVANGNTFFRLYAPGNGISNDYPFTSAEISFSDTASDSSIIGNRQLYTGGGEVANAAPPPSSYVSLYQNRVMLTPSENPTTIWYSKQNLPNTPVEFSLSFTFPLGTTREPIVAHSQMDSNFIIFTQNSVFTMVGTGPAPNGELSDFSTPSPLPVATGCRDAASLVLTPVGLMYMSPKGLWLLDRGLTNEYIGADVEAYSQYTVTGAVHIPGTTQVRFTISSGVALVYDYYVKTWDVFNNQAAVGAIATGTGSYAYLQANGVVMLETAGTYTDNGAFIPLYLQTAWVQVAGFQGIQRVYDLLILGTYYGAHQLQVTVAYDFNPATAQTVVVTPTSGTPYQWRVPLQRQVCQAIQITIQDVQTSGYNQGLALTGLTLRAGVKPGTNKLSAARTFG